MQELKKSGEEITKNVSYILQFTGSARFMANSLSNLANNLHEGIHRINLSLDTMIKNVKYVELSISIATVFWNTQI